MTFLLASLVVLGLGPMLYRLAGPRLLSIVDTLVVVVVAGIVLVQILPNTVMGAGLGTIAVFAVGFLAPTLVERVSREAEHPAHLVTLLLAFLGLSLHALVDGTILGVSRAGEREVLRLAVILHRVPVGLTIWWLLQPQFGATVALGVLFSVGASTVIGFFAGSALADALAQGAMPWFEALVAGSLLHVVAHHYPWSKTGNGSLRVQRAVGTVLGLALLGFLLGSEACTVTAPQ